MNQIKTQQKRNYLQCQHCKNWVHWVFIQSVEALPVCIICIKTHEELEENSSTENEKSCAEN
jgi:hypothetical protein